MTNQIDRWGHEVQRLNAAATAAKAEYTAARKSVEESQGRLAATEEARAIAQAVAQTLQEQAHTAISAVVSRCLSAVFAEPYEFKIIFEQKRGRTEAKMVFERDGHAVDPLTASGGGVVDLAALALRLACLQLRQPAHRPVLVFDEPFKSPSPHYRERVKTLLETLAAEMGVQFVMVTNIMELVTGNVVDLDTLPAKPKATAASVLRRLKEKED